MMMKIISWNVWVKNIDSAGNLRRLMDEFDADVYCLQEVTKELLEQIHDLEFQILDYIYCFDYRKYKDGYYQNYYLVILSKYKIENPKINKISINHLTKRSLWDRLMKWDESIEFQYADIRIEGTWLRIFNIHLELSAGPNLRLNQFRQVLDYFEDEAINVVCGDFNVYAKPSLNFLIGWAMGFRLVEYVIHERKKFDEMFENHNLINVFEGEITFAERKLQLDHILIPDDVEILDSEVVENTFGSDHFPLITEIDI